MNSGQDLKNFDSLPDSAHVDVNVVAGIFGCKVPTVWARVRRGELESPRKFGAHSRWRVGYIRELLSPEAA